MPDIPQPPAEFDRPPITERDLARRWRKSIRTLQRLRRDGGGPAYIRIGRRIYYLLADVQAFEQACRIDGDPGT